MYRFVDVDRLPKSVMSTVQTVFGDVNLDKSLRDIYKTLNVTGRGMQAIKLNTTDRVAADGVWVDDASYDARIITVRARLSGDPKDWSRRLMPVLWRQEKRLAFSDDLGWHYDAYFTGVSDITDDGTDHIVDLEFYCKFPFKRGDKRVVTSATGEVRIPHSPSFGVAPDIVSVIFNESVERAMLWNLMTKKKVNVNYRFEPGQNMWFLFSQQPPTITTNSGHRSLMKYLDVYSDFDRFAIFPNNVIRIALPGGDPVDARITIEYRGALP